MVNVALVMQSVRRPLAQGLVAVAGPGVRAAAPRPTATGNPQGPPANLFFF